MLKYLSEGNLAITFPLTDEQKSFFDDLNLLTYKKFVYAANVTEDMMDIGEERLREILGLPDDKNITVVAICAKLEAEMVEMSPEERKAFLDEMGLITTGLDNLIKKSYEALNLQYYFTS
jgi:ribosome-binding ATPase